MKLAALMVLLSLASATKPLPKPQSAPYADCANFGNDDRFDCFPENGASQEACEARGCCWVPAGFSKKAPVNSKLPPLDVPWCFYPRNYGSYKTVNVSNTATGKLAFFQRQFQSPYPNDVVTVRVDVEYQTDTAVRIKMSDPNNKRFEPAYPKITRKATKAADNPQYNVVMDVTKTGFQVNRLDGTVLFNALNVGGLTFADQFLQISSLFNGTIYGIGEHRTTLWLEPEWQRYTLWNRDSPPFENTNLYGSQPFYIGMEPSSGRSYGVWLHNSNAMDVLTQPLPAITFRTIGGILDLYVFVGPTPADVLRQYQDLVGLPLFPPYWGLGSHLCRYGYGSAAATRAVWQRTIDAKIPFDVQWNDIDYMITQNDFTVDPVNFGDLPQLVNDIHSAGMHYLTILDPGVSAAEPPGTYPAYDDGISKDVFVKDKYGKVFIAKTWNPVSTAYPDFSHPGALDYWETLLRQLHDKINFDGMWIDMNEPSNFLDGSFDGCPQDNLENPPYTPGVLGDKLSAKTLCVNAKHAAGDHYNVHNLYGIYEAEVTNQALKNMGKRPFVISRATFSGSQKYTGHWGGDNGATWYDLTKSIPELLQFSIYGFSFMGSDICGFRDESNEALCNRWVQLGAFYPFSRNHNTMGSRDQDPVAMGDQVVQSSIKALTARYQLLPYLYTLLYNAHVYGDTVARPLFVEFPKDTNTYKIDRTFLWGSGLYIIPVTEESATTVRAYLPAARWYDWYTGAVRDSPGQEETFDAPLDTIPLLIQGGNILPTQAPNTTTTLSRKNKFIIIAAPDASGNANGSLYWDDGDSIDPIENNVYGLLKFSLSGKELKSEVVQWKSPDTPSIGEIRILGIGTVTRVQVNSASATFNVDSSNALHVTGLNIPLSTAVTLTWS